MHMCIYDVRNMSNNCRAIKRANSMLTECHKELDTFTTEHQSNAYNQPNDIEMSNADDEAKVKEAFLCARL